jgi:hypothetical protein
MAVPNMAVHFAVPAPLALNFDQFNRSAACASGSSDSVASCEAGASSVSAATSKDKDALSRSAYLFGGKLSIVSEEEPETSISK